MKKQKQLSDCEAIIAKSQGCFYDIGRALYEIQQHKLYKQALFDTFESYTRVRWDMGRSQAYRMISAYKVMYNLSPIGDKLPANESQARPLIQLDPITQRKIWQDFLSSGMDITALNIRKFIRSAGRRKPSCADTGDQISTDYMAAVNQMLEQVRQARQDGWEQTSRQAALLWHRVIRENILSGRSGTHAQPDP